MRKRPILFAVLLIGAVPSSVLAQDLATDPVFAGDLTQQDDDDFPWGLLGLLGLVGLYGLKRDDRQNHIKRGNRS